MQRAERFRMLAILGVVWIRKLLWFIRRRLKGRNNYFSTFRANMNGNLGRNFQKHVEKVFGKTRGGNFPPILPGIGDCSRNPPTLGRPGEGWVPQRCERRITPMFWDKTNAPCVSFNPTRSGGHWAPNYLSRTLSIARGFTPLAFD